MKYFVIFFVSCLLSAQASAKGLSPVRYPNESYETARNRHYFLGNFGFSPYRKNKSKNVPKTDVSAEGSKKPLSAINPQDIVDVGSYADLENQFNYIRDTRFVQTDDPNFPRRITWLYPDDGCYARAEMMKYELENNHFPAPKKIFAFGDLFAFSNNSPSGYVQWWYHVAVTYRVGADVYVFDPSIEPLRPITLQTWNDLIGGDDAPLRYSICSADTVDPMEDCFNPTRDSLEDTISAQKSFLESEWDRVIELKRKPEEELGSYPPWL